MTCSDEKCIKIAQDYIDDLNMKNKFIKDTYGENNVSVKRSSGVIESDWKIDYNDTFCGCINYTLEGISIHVVQDTSGLSKYIRYNEFLEMNKK